ncbi:MULTISPECIES: SRPBCC family protein [Rhodococcus]|uniref:SRPBCC family protein n=1 Tax=Rhodococcus jostii TaxID=132919 RepID=A0ABU4C9L0_RHOJO|nr:MULTISPECIES: SRPBCC family protein [Rhodococcus]MDI9935333.1 SRPBCC family protein [Rhodococcus sp. IEGM 1351]MDJ0414366.1 SRPBCC family protein [Rhodococcus opacus]MDV6280239.1 SRPBCC family protein [Rhodococcus jostii]WKN57580.1 SRPBCC family protein [Rhodococcus opacus]GLK41205.1 transcriptional regulator [Rhodococcus wratislaviensis]
MTTADAFQIYAVYIKATPEAIWDAITKPEWSQQYGYGGLVDYDLRAGGAFRSRADDAMKEYPGVPDVIVDGEVIESDPPKKLVQTWRMLMDADNVEGFTTLTYEIVPSSRPGVAKLTVTHDLTNAPGLAEMVAGRRESEGAGGGWNEVLSGMKTLLETGQPMVNWG